MYDQKTGSTLSHLLCSSVFIHTVLVTVPGGIEIKVSEIGS